MENESVKCVVAVNALITNQGKILLIKQNRPEKAKGKWGLPGGKVDKGETFIEALYREVMEEVGIKIEHAEIKKIAILHDFPETTCKHLFTVELKYAVNNFNFNPEEIQSIEWHDLNSSTIPVQDFRNDWVYYLVNDYRNGVFSRNNFIYSIGQ